MTQPLLTKWATDIQSDNILLSLESMEKLKDSGELATLCDFGEARMGADSYSEQAMPDLYRAPEIILDLVLKRKDRYLGIRSGSQSD